MENLTIRRANIDELNVVQELNHKLFAMDKEKDAYLNQNWSYKEGKSFYTERITSENAICLVANINGKIVGYLAGSFSEGEPWRPVKKTELEDMFIEEEFRSYGIGAKLVQEFLKWSREKGAKVSSVATYAVNDRTIKFYQKMGFVPYSMILEKPLEV